MGALEDKQKQLFSAAIQASPAIKATQAKESNPLGSSVGRTMFSAMAPAIKGAMSQQTPAQRKESNFQTFRQQRDPDVSAREAAIDTPGWWTNKPYEETKLYNLGRGELTNELQREALRSGITGIRRSDDILYEMERMRQQGPVGGGFGQIGEGAYDFDRSGQLAGAAGTGLRQSAGDYREAIAKQRQMRNAAIQAAQGIGQGIPEIQGQRDVAAALQARGQGPAAGAAEADMLRGLGQGPGAEADFAQTLQQRIGQGLEGRTSADAAAQRMLGMADRPMESAAQMQLQRGLEQSIASQAAAAASARGINPAMAARMAADSEAQARQGAVGDAALLRSQEEQQQFGRELGALQAGGALLQQGDVLTSGLGQAERAQDIQALQAAGGLAGSAQGRQMAALGQAGNLGIQGGQQQLGALGAAGGLYGQGRGQGLGEQQALSQALAGLGQQDLGMAGLAQSRLAQAQQFGLGLEGQMFGARTAEEAARQNYFSRALGAQQMPINTGAGIANQRAGVQDARQAQWTNFGQQLAGGIIGGAAKGLGSMIMPGAPAG